MKRVKAFALFSHSSKPVSTSEILSREFIGPRERIEEVFKFSLCVSSLPGSRRGGRKDCWGLCAQREQQFRTGGAVHAQGAALAVAAASQTQKHQGPWHARLGTPGMVLTLVAFYRFGFIWTCWKSFLASVTKHINTLIPASQLLMSFLLWYYLIPHNLEQGYFYCTSVVYILYRIIGVFFQSQERPL